MKTITRSLSGEGVLGRAAALIKAVASAVNSGVGNVLSVITELGGDKKGGLSLPICFR